MSEIEAKLDALGLQLPAPARLSPSIVPKFPWVRLNGNQAFVSGHGPLAPDGSLAEPLGRVGEDLTLEQGHQSARLVALTILASLKTELGNLDKATAWLRVFGMVNAGTGFSHFPLVINGFSNLIVELYGSHLRSAVGMAGLPFDIPVEIEAEIAISV